MIFNIYYGDKFVKKFRCGSQYEGNKECRLVEEEYKVKKYSVKSSISIWDFKKARAH